MNYITDYQLDIDKGFMCKINGIAYQFDFKYSTQKYKYYISNILKLADYLEINRSGLINIFDSNTAYNVIYCDSKQQCYDLCQIIVQLYSRPKQTEHERLVPDVNFIYNDKLYQFTLKILDTKYVWQNVNDIRKHIFMKSHPDLLKIKKELNIHISISQHSEYLGFDTKEDAVKFITYIVYHYYSKSNKKEKTYENQLRKERATIRRGAKPAGNIIHGRRSKASIRRGCIKYQTCIGY